MSYSIADWNVQVIDVPASFEKHVYIFVKGANGTQILQPDLQTVVTLTEGEVPQPTLKISGFLLHALVDELTRKGYRPSHESNIAGKLERTDAHLQDLRHLLKLPSKYDK